MNKVKVVLQEEVLLEFVGAPARSRIVGVQSIVDPPMLQIVIANDRFDEVPLGCESPIAHARVDRSVRLVVDWPMEGS